MCSRTTDKRWWNRSPRHTNMRTGVGVPDVQQQAILRCITSFVPHVCWMRQEKLMMVSERRPHTQSNRGKQTLLSSASLTSKSAAVCGFLPFLFFFLLAFLCTLWLCGVLLQRRCKPLLWRWGRCLVHRGVARLIFFQCGFAVDADSCSWWAMI